MFKKINKILHTPKWLFILLLTVLVLRIPSFFEPYSYGDEMIYLTLGNAIRKGATLYSQIHDNKPPLLYITAFLSGNLFWFKAFLAISHLISVFIFWKLTTSLFPKKKRVQIISTIIFSALTTLPTLEGNIANAELFMLTPTLLAFLILFTKKQNFKNLFLAGILFSVSVLYKVPAIFDVPVIILLWIVSEKKINRKTSQKLIVKTLYISSGFLSPILLTFVWYASRGAFNQYLKAAFLQNIGYLSSWRPDDVVKPFFVRNAPLIVRASIVAIGILTIYWKRKKLSKQFIFATGWLLFSLFAVTLSERPYPHYLIQTTPAAALLFTMLLVNETYEQTLSVIPLSLAFLVPFYFNFWYYPTTSYYTRFIKFAFGKIKRETYLSSFGDQVATNYKVANYIVSSTKPDEKIFVWGDTSTIYALTRRLPPIKYVADYHINDFSNQNEVLNALNKEKPSFVIILNNSDSFPGLRNFLTTNYGFAEKIDSAEVWKLLGPRIRALLSK